MCVVGCFRVQYLNYSATKIMSLLCCRSLFTIFIISTVSLAMNRPVYKIVLNSKGYAQFIQYDIDVAPMREFTLCVWVRVTSLESDQSIFSYVGTDDKRIMRLWLESGGHRLRVSLDHGQAVASAVVEFAAGVWRDVCLSYQADQGAWAVYVDAKLKSCEGSRKLRGFKFPGEGSLIFGYGTSEKGLPAGLTGEIYGVSMILVSTIEHNNTMQLNDVRKRERPIRKSKIKQNSKYIVLGDLATDEVQTAIPLNIKKEYDIFPSDLSLLLQRNNKKKLSKDYLGHVNLRKELAGSGTHDLPIVLEYETPPPISATTSDYSNKNQEKVRNESRIEIDDIIISDIEKPPPLESNTKVYGQWTSTKFANNVLGYLKSIDFSTSKQKKVVSSFPVKKISDLFPYPARINHNQRKLRSTEMLHHIDRRDINGQQFNVKIINPDESDLILPTKHLDPKQVEVTNRGEAKPKLYRTIEDNIFGSQETNFSNNLFDKHRLEAIINNFERHRSNSIMSIIPYLQPTGYNMNNQNNLSENGEEHQLYVKSVSQSDHLHNVNEKAAVDAAPNKFPSFDFRPSLGLFKQADRSNGDSIMIGRALAKEVSDKANQDIYNVPLLKFKHILPAPAPRKTASNNIAITVIDDNRDTKPGIRNNFNKQVKLGNALNEKFIMGFDEHQIKNTFLGGDDAIPDINRYRFQWNSKSDDIPASLETRVCKHVELFVHEDESIGTRKIKAPVHGGNIGIDFIVQSYKKCSMKESAIKSSSLILIDWMKTPVKLFGGAYTKKTTDLCGFF